MCGETDACCASGRSSVAHMDFWVGFHTVLEHVTHRERDRGQEGGGIKQEHLCLLEGWSECVRCERIYLAVGSRSLCRHHGKKEAGRGEG